MTKVARRVLITGASGQLGRELIRCSPPQFQCVAAKHSDLDITDHRSVQTALVLHRPWAIINAAAFTAVDYAEIEANRATAVNAEGPRVLAVAAARHHCRLIQISTDYVFGASHGTPHRPSDIPTPMGVYARTKEQGERAVRENLPSALILRTGWLYSVYGNNFVKTIIELMRTNDSVHVTDDQIGTPTWAFGLANAIWQALDIDLNGTHHWTDAGIASRYDFAVAIAEESSAIGLLTHLPAVVPMNTIDDPAKALRPAFSVLDKQATWAALGIRPPHWRVYLRLMLKEFIATKECAGDA